MRNERISLWLLGAMLCLPFLVPIHLKPISTFYPEWLAGALGLAAAMALLARRGTIHWPASGYLPLLFVLLLLAQTLGSILAYAETGLLAMLYLIWAMLVMATAATLKERLGLEAVAEHLAIWLLAGAAANALAGTLVYGGVHSAWLMPNGSGSMFGNLGQPNHFAHHLWLGIASALYLATKRRLSPAFLVALLCLLLPASALSGSRASLVYAVWIALAGFYWNGFGDRRRGIAVALAYLACAFLLPLWIGGQSTPITRSMAEIAAAPGAGGSLRPMLFAIGWNMFLQSPWLGTGFGSFARESFAVAATHPDWGGLGEHAHNLVAQLLGELGLFAALGAGVALYLWARGTAARRQEPAVAWLAGIVGIALLHSLVEYPLWFVYFLGVFAVALALGDTRTRPLRLGIGALAAPVLLGLLACVLLARDYRSIQALELAQRMRPLTAATLLQRNRALLNLRAGSLLKPYIDETFLSSTLPTVSELQAKLALCRLNLRFQPTAPAVFTCALVYRLAGETAAAERLWKSAGRAFPGDMKTYLEVLEDVLDEDALRRLRPLAPPST